MKQVPQQYSYKT